MKRCTILAFTLSLCVAAAVVFLIWSQWTEISDGYMLAAVGRDASVTRIGGTTFDNISAPWNWAATKHSDTLPPTPQPSWLRSYFEFHASSRRKYIGAALLTDPAAPPVLLRHCPPSGSARIRNYYCGGLADRLATLPLDLYLANLTGRVLLIQWAIPYALEEFLIPSGDVNWTVPRGTDLGDDPNAALRLPTFDVGYTQSEGQFRAAVEELLSSDARVYRIVQPSMKYGNMLVRDGIAAAHPTRCNRTDAACADPSEAPTFGLIFRALFRTSPAVRSAVDETRRRAGLGPGDSYSAVHTRLRHPNGWSKGRRTDADRHDIPWDDESSRSHAINVTAHAIECAAGNPPPKPNSPERGGGGPHVLDPLVAGPPEPLYLFSDSNETVALFTAGGSGSSSSPLAGRLDPAPRIISRDVSTEALHLGHGHRFSSEIGEEKRPTAPPPPSAYFGTFVDLLIAAEARCVTYGMGGFGKLAAQVGGTSCTARHREAGRIATSAVDWDYCQRGA